MPRVTGLWVYQSLSDSPPDPDAVAAQAAEHAMRWVTAEAVVKGEVSRPDWLREMRRATRERGLGLGIHGYAGRPQPAPRDEARAFSKAIDVADADFAIVNAEKEYRDAPGPVSRRFTETYRELRPRFRSYFSSFGRPEFHGGLDWAAWANADFRGMPQAYENLNAEFLRPDLCVDDYARFFPRDTMRVTLGCFEEHGKKRLPVRRLVSSVREVPALTFNVYRHGTVTAAELDALDSA